MTLFQQREPVDQRPGPRFDRVGVSVVLPAYNEEENVAEAVQRVVDVAGRLGLDYEVIVVDDGSRDRTGSVASAVAAQDHRVRVLRHSKNRGYGAALRTGFAAATKEFIFFTDTDLQFDVEDLPVILTLRDSHDLVVGYRVSRQDGWARVIKAKLWHRLVSMLLGYLARDIDCAFKLLRREVVADSCLESEGALINTELLFKARMAGRRIAEVGVRHFPRARGVNTGASARVAARALAELVRFRWGQQDRPHLSSAHR